jgi:hypothetical protein
MSWILKNLWLIPALPMLAGASALAAELAGEYTFAV